MKSSYHKALFLLFIPCLLLLVACSPVPIVTVIFVDDGENHLQFHTNHQSYLGTANYYQVAGSFQATMTVVEFQAFKNSGKDTTGFGGVFCWQGANDFYTVQINTNGRYIIKKYVAGVGTIIRDWTNSALLNTGYNASNTIQVDYDNHDFTISFNGTAVAPFTDTSFSGGESGFVAGVSSEENFPGIPVDFRFRMLQPVVAP